MKILVIAPTPFFTSRGTHIRILEESLAMEKAGHQVTIATYHIGGEIPPHLKSSIKIHRIRRLLFWYKKLEAGPDWQKILLDIMLIRKAFHLARTQKPDILYGHLHEGLAIGWVVQKALFWRKMKLIGDLHGSLTNEMKSHGYLKNFFLLPLFRKMEKWIDTMGDQIFTSSWENTEYVKRFREDGNVQTLLDGVNPDHFRGLPSKEALRKEWNLPQDKTIFVYTGALIPNKGINILLTNIEQALSQESNMHFVLAGYPVEAIQTWIQKNDFSSSITLISPLDYFKLPRLLGACDFGIDPKNSETLQASGKILNYMGAGLPVVCFERENNRKYLGEGGIYAKRSKDSSLKDAFEYADALSQEQKTQLGEKNKNASQKFIWKSLL